MLSSNPIILEMLSLLLQHGVRDVVVCPGSRNAGIVHSLCQVQDFQTHAATDERSAGFMAIGMSDATGLPTAVVVTSGSALANLLPAACEAYYRGVPVVFISADRPAAWIGQMDGQTMPQPGALGQMVRACVDLPEDNLWHANRLLNEALLACYARRPRGPVHINIPISEPIYEFTAPSLPEARVIRLVHGVPTDGLSAKSTLLVVGQMAPREVPPIELLERVAEHCTIVAETLSNLPPHVYTNPTRIDWARMPQVDRVITLGGHIINKDLKAHLRKNPPREHWHVSPDGAVADLFCCQTHAVQASTKDFLQGMVEQQRLNVETHGSASPKGRAILDEDALPCVSTFNTAPSSDPRTDLLQRLFSLLPTDAAVHLANSTTVRLAQEAIVHCPLSIIHYYCNRGINGIEGSVSTAVGHALACPERKVFLITGDLSFFYDRNGLWTSPLPQNLRILVLNDGGGNIFNTLPLPSEPEHSRQAIMGTHSTSARHTAEQHGLLYLQGAEQMEAFVQAKRTSLLEIINYSNPKDS